MAMFLYPWHVLSVIVAGILTEQQRVIEYLREEHRVLREQLGGIFRSYHRAA